MPDSGCSGEKYSISKVSRFVREIPRELVDLGQEAQEKKKKIEEMIQADRNLAKMKMAFETKTFKPREFKGDEGCCTGLRSGRHCPPH